MFNRAGGAPTFAVGMAHMFARVSASPTALALWYHFAIMFEALFILTTIDAGTRVGRFLAARLAWETCGVRSVIRVPGSRISFASLLLVAAWGWFLYQGVIDPLGRHQHPLAAVWAGEPTPFRDRALSRHDLLIKMGKRAIFLSHLFRCFSWL